MRGEWTGWTQISEVKSIELVGGSHAVDKGEEESRETSVSGLAARLHRCHANIVLLMLTMAGHFSDKPDSQGQ